MPKPSDAGIPSPEQAGQSRPDSGPTNSSPPDSRLRNSCHLLIIAGGINRCGVARDIAGLGIKVGPVDMNDLGMEFDNTFTEQVLDETAQNEWAQIAQGCLWTRACRSSEEVTVGRFGEVLVQAGAVDRLIERLDACLKAEGILAHLADLASQKRLPVKGSWVCPARWPSQPWWAEPVSLQFGDPSPGDRSTGPTACPPHFSERVRRGYPGMSTAPFDPRAE